MDNRRDNNIRDDRYNDHNRVGDRANDNKHLFRLGELDDYKVASDDPDVRGWTIVDRNNRELGTISELIVDVDKERVRYLDVTPAAGIYDGSANARFDDRRDTRSVDRTDSVRTDTVDRRDTVDRTDAVDRSASRTSGSADRREDGDHHLLLPIGIARLDEREDKVIMNDLDRDLLNSFPSHRGEVITRDYEYAVVERLNGIDRRERDAETDRRNVDKAIPENRDRDFYENRFYDEDRFYTNRSGNRSF